MKRANLVGWCIAFVVALILPFLVSDYWLHSLISGLFYVLMASSWNLIAGYTGQVSFAHAAFAGIGCYTSGILAVKFGIPPFFGILTGIILAALLSLTLGALCIRMGGIYLSLTTLGFSEIVRIIIQNEYKITRGTMGLKVPFLFGNYSKITAFYIMLAAVVLVLVGIYFVLKSDLGLQFRAVQNDEIAAASVGVPVVFVRLTAFVMAGSLAALAGGLYGHYLLLITPHIPSLDTMFLVLAMTVIGGMGTMAGPVVGALFLEILSEYIRVYGEFHVLVFAIVAMIFARFFPQGIVGFMGNLIKQKT